MKKDSTLFADIVLPLAGGPFTYAVSPDIVGRVAPGVCVAVGLGRNKFYTGVIWKLHNDRPSYAKIKTIDRILEGSPVVSVQQRELWEWIASYYMCNIGDVMKVALPSALKPSAAGMENFEAGIYKPPTVTFVKLCAEFSSGEKLNEAFEKMMRRAPKQYEALVEIAGELPQVTHKPNVGAKFSDTTDYSAPVRRQVLTSSGTVLRQLSDKGIISIYSVEAERGALPELPPELPLLSSAQQEAKENLEKGFTAHDVVLLHGATGSGKTEIYLHLIAQTLRRGLSVLFLLPEIAMTSQLIERIRLVFGERVIPYHSSFDARKRTERYRMASEGGGLVVVGTRSSVFLPLPDTGLIIVDEEHDPSFKSSESSPRYSARDTATVLARLHGAKVLLGSATPSLESYYNAREGKYGYVRLDERYGGAVLPQVIISDSIRAMKRGERKSHFNPELLRRMEENLASGRQSILFQNRRGFSPYVECGECGWMAPCPHCNVTLTLHKGDGLLKCHYCGYTMRSPSSCPACGLQSLVPKGFGTEKVEDEISAIFPEAIVSRLDRDTASTPARYGRIIEEFASGKSDILVGTQMITKGFDFGNVTLVGVLNADNLMAFPDFRASERAFQSLAQVAGRAGRRTDEGVAIIQTSQPGNPVIKQAAAFDYDAMARMVLAEREAFFYPPFCRIINVTLKHPDKVLLEECGAMLGSRLREIFGRRLSGPQPPPVDRVRGEWLLQMMLKVEKQKPYAHAKELLAEAIAQCRGKFRSIKISVDVDPQ